MPDLCSTCGAAVQRYITLGGRIVDLETTPTEDGNHVLVHRGRTTRCRVLGGHEMPAPPGINAYPKHKCRPPAKPGPPCASCFLPMNKTLYDADGCIHHPACEPEFLKQIGASTPRRKGHRR